MLLEIHKANEHKGRNKQLWGGDHITKLIVSS